MKNMFKRVMALLLALVMTMSLAACGNSDKENQTSAADKTQAQTQAGEQTTAAQAG